MGTLPPYSVLAQEKGKAAKQATDFSHTDGIGLAWKYTEVKQ